MTPAQDTAIGTTGTAPIVVAAVAGMIFGAGLFISGMVDANKVLNFLDIAAIESGGWDPSLAFVMGAGLFVSVIGQWMSKGRAAPRRAPLFHHPARVRIDGPLVGGAAVFGVGWGLSGICPGPALANLALVPTQILAFVVAMGAGSYLGYRVLSGRPLWTSKDLMP